MGNAALDHETRKQWNSVLHNLFNILHNTGGLLSLWWTLKISTSVSRLAFWKCDMYMLCAFHCLAQRNLTPICLIWYPNSTNCGTLYLWLLIMGVDHIVWMTCVCSGQSLASYYGYIVLCSADSACSMYSIYDSNNINWPLPLVCHSLCSAKSVWASWGTYTHTYTHTHTHTCTYMRVRTLQQAYSHWAKTPTLSCMAVHW